MAIRERGKRRSNIIEDRHTFIYILYTYVYIFFFEAYVSVSFLGALQTFGSLIYIRTFFKMRSHTKNVFPSTSDRSWKREKKVYIHVVADFTVRNYCNPKSQTRYSFPSRPLSLFCNLFFFFTFLPPFFFSFFFLLFLIFFSFYPLFRPGATLPRG